MAGQGEGGRQRRTWMTLDTSLLYGSVHVRSQDAWPMASCSQTLMLGMARAVASLKPGM